jgi:hypothetical protein
MTTRKIGHEKHYSGGCAGRIHAHDQRAVSRSCRSRAVFACESAKYYTTTFARFLQIPGAAHLVEFLLSVLVVLASVLWIRQVCHEAADRTDYLVVLADHGSVVATFATLGARNGGPAVGFANHGCELFVAEICVDRRVAPSSGLPFTNRITRPFQCMDEGLHVKLKTVAKNRRTGPDPRRRIEKPRQNARNQPPRQLNLRHGKMDIRAENHNRTDPRIQCAWHTSTMIFVRGPRAFREGAD